MKNSSYDNQVINLKKYKFRPGWNIGSILFLIIFIYLFITIVAYFTKEHISAYEVREGSIIKDTTYTGMILREEQVVKAESSGYVNYFLDEGQKIGANANAYTISREKLQIQEAVENTEKTELSTEEWEQLLLSIQDYHERYTNTNFKSAKVLKEEFKSILSTNSTENRAVQLSSLLEQSSGDQIRLVSSEKDGIIQYSYDGFENMKIEDVTSKELGKVNYQKIELLNNENVKAGDAVYRLITNDEWELVIPLTKEDEAYFSEAMGKNDFLNVNVKMKKDSETVKGALQIYDKGKEGTIGVITFYNSMIRYAQERYLDVEVILADESGLKIPKSACVKKEALEVPASYITKGDASQKIGVYLIKSNGKVEFTPVEYLDYDEAKSLYYIEVGDFNKKDRIAKPESDETYTLNKASEIDGVYRVNKGYASYVVVDILCESDDYYIIKEGEKGGLENYDHIALDGENVYDNMPITQ